MSNLRVSSSLTMVIVLCAIALFVVAPASVKADSSHRSDTLEASDFLSGSLTANQGKVLEIDGTRYVVHPTVTVTDDEGNQHSLSEMGPGDLLKFRLNHGRVKQIVEIIWIRPR